MRRFAALMLAACLLLGALPSQAAAAKQAVRASAVLGATLVNARGEPLGTVDDLVFDARSGALALLVAGGLAYRASGLQVRRDGKLSTSHTPAPYTAPRWPAMRVSELIHKEVVDRLHRDFGEIRDLQLDLAAPRVRAAIVDRRDDWAAGEALVTVPIERFSLPRDLPDKVALNYTRERFE